MERNDAHPYARQVLAPGTGERYTCRPPDPGKETFVTHRLLVLVLLASVGLALPASGQATAGTVDVATVHGSAIEHQAREQLLRIVSTWDLSPWLFTRTVQIDSGVIPHSHPVLTVNTRYLDNDTAQIATFVHEQLHWFFVQHRAATDSAIAHLEMRFPDAPSGPPEGARDRYSTYLHLLVCALEHDSLRRLFDEDVADRTLRSWRHYPWVYRQVLENPDPIREALRRFGIDDPDARR